MPPGSQSTEERIATLEEAHQQISQDLHGLTNEFRLFAGEIRSALREIGKPQWSTIIAGMGLFVTIGILAFAPMYASSQRLENEITYHRRSEGHPATHERVRLQRQEIDRLRDRLDRWSDAMVQRQMEREP